MYFRIIKPPASQTGALTIDVLFPSQIIGVQPGMTRAIEYVSSEVSERLYRQAHSIKQKPPEEKLSGRALEEGGGDEGKLLKVTLC